MRTLILTTVLTLCFQTLMSQSIERADSLFEARKFTESFEIYEQLYQESRQVSPAMLLKMAYIKEGLGGYDKALFYLNLYYLHTADKKVLEKMDVLAKKREIKGYEFSDFEFIQSVFYKYYTQIVGVLATISILMLAATYYTKRKQGVATLPAVGMVLTLGLLFYVLNFGRDYNKAIIVQPNALLMTGPSAAAEVIKIVDKGSRLSTLGEQDVWVKVKIDNQTGYIKADKLKQVQL